MGKSSLNCLCCSLTFYSLLPFLSLMQENVTLKRNRHAWFGKNCERVCNPAFGETMRNRAMRLSTGKIAAVFAVLAATQTTWADAPKLPKITGLQVQPATLTLSDSRDVRSIIVTGQTASGYSVDLSPVAKVMAKSGIVSVDENGTVTPLKAGSTMLTVSAAANRFRFLLS